MRQFLLLLLICSVLQIQAQEFKTAFSSSGSIKDDVVTFHRYGNKLYSSRVNQPKAQFAFSANLKKVKYGIELTQYDEQLNVIKKVSVDKEEKDFGPFTPIVHYGNEAIYILYSKFMDDDKIKMHVAKVNPDDLSTLDTKEIMEHDQKNQALFGAMKTIESTQIFYTVSKDGKNMWIVQASPTLILSTVIDGNLNVIQKPISQPVSLKNLVITGTHIGDDGNKVLAYRYDDPSFKEFYTRGIFFQPANAKGIFKTIKFPAGFNPGNLDLQESRDGKKLFYGGEYFGEEYKEGGKGVLLGEINVVEKSISKPILHTYTDELRQRVFDLDFASRKKGEIVFKDHRLNYYINELESGTVILSAEMQTSASTTNYTFYYAGPIIHVFVKPDGKANMTLIPKNQPSQTVTRYFNYVYQDKLICIYADIPKFLDKELSDKKIGGVRSVGDMVPVANVYDSDGKLLSRKKLLDNAKDMKGNVMIGNRSKIGDNKFLFPVGESKVNMAKYYTRVNQVFYLDIL